MITLRKLFGMRIYKEIKPIKILFVCRGNVGRSQMAEAILRHISHGEYIVQSAGTEAMGSEGKDLDGMLLKDRPSSKYVIEVLHEIGLDVGQHYIKRLTKEMADSADSIIVITKPESVPEFLKEKKNVMYWDITDPDEQTLEFHRATRDRIQKLVEELIQSFS